MERYSIRNVNVIDVMAGSVSRDTSVEVENGRIVSVGGSGEGFEHIDGNGGWLMPGLFEMHGHFYTVAIESHAQAALSGRSGYITSYDAALPLYLANGVTTVCSKSEETPVRTYAARAAIERGELVGPRILSAGRCLNRGPKLIDAIVAAESIDELLQAYRDERDDIDCVKIYIFMTPEWLAPLAKEAHADGLKVYGHLGGMTAYDAVSAGLDGLEHGVFFMPEFKQNVKIPDSTPTCGIFAEYANFDPRSDRAKALIELLLEHDVALTPTVCPLEAMLSPETVDYYAARDVWSYYGEDIRDAMRKTWEDGMAANDKRAVQAYFEDVLARQAEFMAEFHRGGGRIFAGTDPVVVPVFGGISMPREACHLQSFGMTPMEVLTAMTLGSAKELKVDGVTGAIAPGLAADMILLEKNPLADLRNLETVELVVKGGARYAPGELRKAAKGKLVVDR